MRIAIIMAANSIRSSSSTSSSSSSVISKNSRIGSNTIKSSSSGNSTISSNSSSNHTSRNNSTCSFYPQQGDLRLSGPPSGQGASSGARTRDRWVPADLRADSQATVLPTPLK
ncbi:hypothetical protein PoB_007012200 [Plakobranchus ocellatus]|uniref:Uncharacterized protein n=1 Tax=Plakobranchus ocellatus TaxID=259542 RepID=A0AAV4DH86_9GAST|nr:hypothetical protein PoB_007012200 [Plakobranchus ocellatus]